MKSVYKISLALLFLGGLLTAPLQAHSLAEYTKTIKREFDITANGTTSLSNKYGRVEVKTWNRNRVKIDVTIVVNANSEKNAQEVFDRIDIAFNNAPNYVKAVTNIQPANKGFWNWAGGNKTDFQINYEVFLPATNNLELAHRYGDAFVAEMTGTVTADLKYANTKIEGVGDGSDIILAYGNGSLVRALDLNADLSYAKFNIAEARDVNIESKYTQVSIEQALDITCTSKYDDYKIGSVRDFRNEGKYDNINIGAADNVEVNSKYTQVNVDEVRRSLDLDLAYGGSNSCLARGFSQASLIGSYSDFKICVNRDDNYQIDASASYAGIDYPRGLQVTYEIEKSSSHELKGYRGDEGNAALIRARLSYGGLKVREN